MRENNCLPVKKLNKNDCMFYDFSLCDPCSGGVVSERSTALCHSSLVAPPQPRAGTGRFAAIFCPTTQPSQGGNQPGLHCRFVPGSGQWLLTDFSLPRMEMSVSVWFFLFVVEGNEGCSSEVSRKRWLYHYYFSLRPRPRLPLCAGTKSTLTHNLTGANYFGFTVKMISLSVMLLNKLKNER